jgi:hypothetical protein
MSVHAGGDANRNRKDASARWNSLDDHDHDGVDHAYDYIAAQAFIRRYRNTGII